MKYKVVAFHSSFSMLEPKDVAISDVTDSLQTILLPKELHLGLIKYNDTNNKE